MTAWRQRWPDVKLVYPTFFAFPAPVLRCTSERLAAAGIDAINLHHRILTGGSAEVAHRSGLKLFAWGLRRHRDIRRVSALGADAVFVDEVIGS